MAKSSGSSRSSSSSKSSSGSRSSSSSSTFSLPSYSSSSVGGGYRSPKGPPPAYSFSNPVGGAHTNIYERPPSYSSLQSQIQSLRDLIANFGRGSQITSSSSSKSSLSTLISPSNSGSSRSFSAPSPPAKEPSYSTYYYHSQSRSSTGYQDENPYNYTLYYQFNTAIKTHYLPNGHFVPIATLLYLCLQLL
ncbi:putative protein TPRXL [Drosophila rhopaloa]|nr:putative protein TPRXL [Drosophila rhopaloa]